MAHFQDVVLFLSRALVPSVYLLCVWWWWGGNFSPGDSCSALESWISSGVRDESRVAVEAVTRTYSHIASAFDEYQVLREFLLQQHYQAPGTQRIVCATQRHCPEQEQDQQATPCPPSSFPAPGLKAGLLPPLLSNGM